MEKIFHHKAFFGNFWKVFAFTIIIVINLKVAMVTSIFMLEYSACKYTYYCELNIIHRMHILLDFVDFFTIYIYVLILKGIYMN